MTIDTVARQAKTCSLYSYLNRNHTFDINYETNKMISTTWKLSLTAI